MDLEQKLIEIVREGTKDTFTLDHAERIAFSLFSDKNGVSPLGSLIAL